ncbi:MAG: PaaI family thioesterase [Candidatus Hodarchaeales archaeon]|jgi:acyl-CoA thioesterase FadM
MNDQYHENNLNLSPIPNDWTGKCFGCSKSNVHGLQLSFWPTHHGCITECTVPDYFCGPEGIVHGGIVATLLDEVAAWTIISQLFQLGITREISVRYLSPVRVNTKIQVEGELVEHDVKSALILSTVKSINGILLTEAKSKWFLPSHTNLAKIFKKDEEELVQILEEYIQPIQQYIANYKEKIK